MPNLPVSYLPGENIMREDAKAVHVKNNVLGLGYNLVYGALWLTSQRLIFQSLPLGNLIIYPLSHINNAIHVDVRISGDRYNSFDSAFYLEFDNGGQEYFIPQDISAWVVATLSVKASAPALPFTQTPPNRSAVQEGQRGLWFFGGILVIVVLCFLCSVAACVGFPFLLSMLSKNGG
jgi:hypothetical protein